MKRLLVILIVIVLLLFGTVIVLPFFFKDDVVAYIKGETLNADLDFNEDIELSIISSFPDLTLGIKDLSVINRAPFAGDTLVHIGSFRATIDIWSILDGKYIVRSVDINDVNSHVQINKDGIASYDIALASDTSAAPEAEETPAQEEESAYNLQLEHLALHNVNVVYNDSLDDMYTKLKGLNFSMNGAFDAENMSVNTELDIAEVIFAMEKVRYVDKAQLGFTAGYDINLKESIYTIKENTLALNEVKLGFDGKVAMPGDDIDLDLTFDLKESAFKDLLSLVPAIYTKDYEGLQADGAFLFNGKVQGVYNDDMYPTYEVNLAIKDGAFQYPDLPTALNNVQLQTKVFSKKEGDLDNMVVDMSKLHFDLDQEPFEASAYVSTPISDLNIRAALAGTIDLERVKNLIPLEDVSRLAGVVETNVNVAGRMSSLDAERYEEFTAAGFVNIKNFAFAANYLPMPIGMPVARMEFSPEFVAIPQLDLQLGKSDASLKGSVSKYIGYVFRDDTLKGELSLASNYFAVDPWLEEDETSSDASSETAANDQEPTSADEEGAFLIPENIHFVFASAMKEVDYDTYNMKNFNGNIVMANGVLNFNSIDLEMMGGKLELNGYYSTQNPSKPTSSIAFNMNQVSIPGAYQTFNTVQKLMPIAAQLEGNMNGNLQFTSQLDQEYMPVYESMNGKGKLDIKRAILNENNVWGKIVETLRWDEGKKRLVLLNIKPSFGIKDGRLTLDPLDFTIEKVACNLSGSSGFDNTIDYILLAEIPAQQLQNTAKQYLDKLAGRSLNLPIGETVKVEFIIGGTMDKPTVTPKFMGTGGDGKSLKDLAKEEFEKRKEEVKEEVVKKTKEELRKQADALRDEAAVLRRKAQQLKNEAAKLSAEGERLKKESDALKAQADKEKAKLEAELKNVPKPLRKKAMEAADQLYSKADDKLDEANKYFDMAKKPEQEADKLLQRADALERKADETLKE